MGKISGSTIVLIVVIVVFGLLDTLLLVALFVEKGKFEGCKSNQSPFCPFIACNQDRGNDTAMDRNTAEWKACDGNAYRFIDPNAERPFAKNNIQCLYGYGGATAVYEPE